jgi:ketosteroid isomerase-like protein
MLSKQDARDFAQDWIDSWNSHDLDRIMGYYAENCELTTPFVVTMLNKATGKLKGKAKMRGYWATVLASVPALRFDLLDVLIGVDSMTIYYRALHGRIAAEVLFFDEEGKVVKAVAHYDQV